MNWGTQILFIRYETSDGTFDVTPIDSFQPTFQMPGDPLHSIEQTHIGFVFGAAQISFTMTVKQTGRAMAALTALALQRKRFNIHVQEQNGVTDWSLDSLVLRDCIIQSVQAGPIQTTGLPTAILSGVSLQTTIDYHDQANSPKTVKAGSTT